MLTNEIFSGKYIFAITDKNASKFNKKGSNELFIGTKNQIVEKLEVVNTSEKILIFMELPSNLPILENQKILIQNLVSNKFIGGKIAFASNNNLVKKLF